MTSPALVRALALSPPYTTNKSYFLSKKKKKKQSTAEKVKTYSLRIQEMGGELLKIEISICNS